LFKDAAQVDEDCCGVDGGQEREASRQWVWFEEDELADEEEDEC